MLRIVGLHCCHLLGCKSRICTVRESHPHAVLLLLKHLLPLREELLLVSMLMHRKCRVTGN